MRASRGMCRIILVGLPFFTLALLVVGCSSEGTLSGKVTYKGEPVQGGSVYFHPEGKDGNFPSVIQTDGSYSVSKLPRGTAKISVIVGNKNIPIDFSKRMGGGSKFAAKGMEQMGRIGK